MSHGKFQIKCETLRNCKIVGRLGGRRALGRGKVVGPYVRLHGACRRNYIHGIHVHIAFLDDIDT